MLSCSCETDDCEWYYYDTSDMDFSQYTSSRGKKCCSCGKIIKNGHTGIKFGRYRAANSDIEERIYGDEVRLADWWMCENCGEIYLNLSAIGYCIYLGDDMRGLLSEYHEMTGFKPGILNKKGA